MEELYGISARDFIEGLKKLEYSLSSAKLDGFNDLMNMYEEFQIKAENKTQE